MNHRISDSSSITFRQNQCRDMDDIYIPKSIKGLRLEQSWNARQDRKITARIDTIEKVRSILKLKFLSYETSNKLEDSTLHSFSSDIEEYSNDRQTIVQPCEFEWILALAREDEDKILDLISEYPYLLSYRDFISGNTCVHWAIKSDETTLMKLLIQNNAPVNIRNNAGESPLVCAVRERKIKHICVLLSNRDIDTDVYDFHFKKAKDYVDYKIPLIVAIKLGFEDQVRFKESVHLFKHEPLKSDSSIFTSNDSRKRYSSMRGVVTKLMRGMSIRREKGRTIKNSSLLIPVRAGSSDNAKIYKGSFSEK